MKTMTMVWHGRKAGRTLLTVICSIVMLYMPAYMYAEPTEDEVTEAVDIIKGKSMYQTKEWAVSVLRNVGEPSLRPKAMNTLAMAYLNGIGVAQDSTQAVKCFEAAAEGGYTNAWHNLGMMSKNAAYGRQDFVRAVECFEKGAAAGSLMCSYDAGYMYYKGLGCRQDYARAVEYFSRGLATGNPSCLYMLGLCYRNGFGVDMDEAKAEEYLRKASLANYRFAIEETLREGAEVQPSVRIGEGAETVPESMPEVEAFLDCAADISGRYSGCLVTYDWSGGSVVREQRLDVVFGKHPGGYCGTWVMDTDTIAFYAGIAPDGRLVFDNTRALMDDRYTEGHKVEYLFDNAELALLGGTLTGGLRLYSLSQKEPQRPMYLSLSRRSADSDTPADGLCYMAAYPVAGTNRIELRFTLPHEVHGVSVTLASQNGMYAKSYTLGALSSGEHRFTITPNLTDGLYIVSMTADGLHGRTAIMLRR